MIIILINLFSSVQPLLSLKFPKIRISMLMATDILILPLLLPITIVIVIDIAIDFIIFTKWF